jgi:hypothetical protein
LKAIAHLWRQFFSSRYAIPDAASLHIFIRVFWDCFGPSFRKNVSSEPPEIRPTFCIMKKLMGDNASNVIFESYQSANQRKTILTCLFIYLFKPETCEYTVEMKGAR